MESNIILGIVSGILTSLLIYIIIIIFNKIIIPWYQKMIYIGIDISGEWVNTHTTPSGTVTNEILYIKQKASKIECVCTKHKKRKNGKEEFSTLKFSGEIEDSIIALIGKNIRKDILGKNTLLLKVVNGGKRLEGYASWFSVTKSDIDYHSIFYDKKI